MTWYSRSFAPLAPRAVFGEFHCGQLDQYLQPAGFADQAGHGLAPSHCGGRPLDHLHPAGEVVGGLIGQRHAAPAEQVGQRFAARVGRGRR